MSYKYFVSMDVAIIGTGRAGQSIAISLADAGHRILLGVRDTQRYAGLPFLDGFPGITATSVEDAGERADMIIIATPAAAVPEVAYFLGDVSSKVILDVTNGPVSGPVRYRHTAEALTRITGSRHVVKCFTTTSYGNPLLSDPLSDLRPETYLAGGSLKAKAAATALYRDLGITQVFDMGSEDSIPTVEAMTRDWMTQPVERPAEEPLLLVKQPL